MRFFAVECLSLTYTFSVVSENIIINHTLPKSSLSATLLSQTSVWAERNGNPTDCTIRLMHECCSSGSNIGIFPVQITASCEPDRTTLVRVCGVTWSLIFPGTKTIIITKLICRTRIKYEKKYFWEYREKLKLQLHMEKILLVVAYTRCHNWQDTQL